MADLLFATIAPLLLGIACVFVVAHVRARRNSRRMAVPPPPRDPRRRPPGLDSEQPEIVLATAAQELALAEAWVRSRRDQGDTGADGALLEIHRAWAAINRVVLREGEVPE